MAEIGSHTWACPSCGRRVPLRADACHCGMTRARAEELAAARPAVVRPSRPRRPGVGGVFRAMPGDVKALVVAGAVVLTAGLGWLVFAPAPPPVVPVLGYVDAGPPPVRKPTPPPRPPFKLPWWK